MYIYIYTYILKYDKTCFVCFLQTNHPGASNHHDSDPGPKACGEAQSGDESAGDADLCFMVNESWAESFTIYERIWLFEERRLFIMASQGCLVEEKS